MRHNKFDALIIEEQFITRDYLRRFTPPVGRAPVVIDVGGYIGDFALYCAHELQAKVLVYEPAAENWSMLQRNLKLNPHLADRVVAVNKGVSAGSEVVANVLVIGREVHVSSHWYANDSTAEQRTFACDSLQEILDANGLDYVDLLKVDCEGGEYDVFSVATPDVFRRIGQIVFEWHRVPGWEDKLPVLEQSLSQAGFSLERRGQLIYATR